MVTLQSNLPVTGSTIGGRGQGCPGRRGWAEIWRPHRRPCRVARSFPWGRRWQRMLRPSWSLTHCKTKPKTRAIACQSTVHVIRLSRTCMRCLHIIVLSYAECHFFIDYLSVSSSYPGSLPCGNHSTRKHSWEQYSRFPKSMHLYMYNVNMGPRESFSSELTFLECHYLILTYGLLLHPVFARTQHRIEAAGSYGLRRIFEKLGLCPFSNIAGGIHLLPRQ